LHKVLNHFVFLVKISFIRHFNIFFPVGEI
jgi:hypothetical protein